MISSLRSPQNVGLELHFFITAQQCYLWEWATQLGQTVQYHGNTMTEIQFRENAQKQMGLAEHKIIAQHPPPPPPPPPQELCSREELWITCNSPQTVQYHGNTMTEIQFRENAQKQMGLAEHKIIAQKKPKNYAPERNFELLAIHPTSDNRTRLCSDCWCLCVYAWVNILTLSPHSSKLHENSWNSWWITVDMPMVGT